MQLLFLDTKTMGAFVNDTCKSFIKSAQDVHVFYTLFSEGKTYLHLTKITYDNEHISKLSLFTVISRTELTGP